MVANDALFELINALDAVSTTLTDMSGVLEAQRDAVANNDLPRLLTITGEQEELAARLERCERRRKNIQARVEQELDVVGIRAIIAALPDGLPFRTRLTELTNELAPKVRELQDQNRRSSLLLRASIDSAQRARTFLIRIAGAEPAYTAPLLNL